MSSYLQQTRLDESRNLLFSHIGETAAQRGKTQPSTLARDTLLASEAKQGGKAAALTRAELPQPDSKLPKDELTWLAMAFSKIFDSMRKGAIQQTLEYTELQRMNLNQSQVVLESTTRAIDKEKKEFALAAKIANFEKDQAKAQQILTWVTIGIGAAMLTFTAVSALFTFGTSLLAVPEELAAESIELTELGATEVLEDGAEDGAIDGEAEEEEALDATESEGDRAPSSMRQTQELMSRPASEAARDSTAVERSLVSKSGQNAKSAAESVKKVLQFVAKKGMEAGMSTFMGSPMLWKGIESLYVSSQLSELAGAEKEVGSALGIVESNKMYFQFFQQLLQQVNSGVDESVKEASDVVESFGKITEAWRQIPYGLASAV